MDRYEWIDATCTPLACLPSEELGENGTGWVLMIGDPGATALVIEGVRDELLALLDRAVAAIVGTIVAEHENAAHENKPESRCPLCAPAGR